MVDVCASDSTIHIRFDSDHLQNPNEQFGIAMLEQMICNTYRGARITKNIDKYGSITDVWVNFDNETDAMHFKLSRAYN